MKTWTHFLFPAGTFESFNCCGNSCTWDPWDWSGSGGGINCQSFRSLRGQLHGQTCVDTDVSISALERCLKHKMNLLFTFHRRNSQKCAFPFGMPCFPDLASVVIGVINSLGADLMRQSASFPAEASDFRSFHEDAPRSLAEVGPPWPEPPWPEPPWPAGASVSL